MSTTTAPTWADPAQISDPVEAARVRRSPIRTTVMGGGELRTVIVDEGSGPRLHVELRTHDGVDVDEAAVLAEALAAQVQRLREAVAGTR